MCSIPPVVQMLTPSQDIVLDLHVPGVVELGRLQDGPGGGGGVAAALHLDPVEEGPVRHVVIGIDLAPDGVAWLEIHEPEGAGADRLEVGGRLARAGAPVRFEQVLGDDHAAEAAERVRPERLRRGEDELHRMAIELLDALDRAVRAVRDGGGSRIGDELPVEDHVVGGERTAVVPGHATLEAPDHPGPVLREAAVVDARDVGGEDRDDGALGIVGGQRLVEDAGGVLILGAGGEVRVQQGRRLPPQDSQRSAAPALARREARRLGLGGDAGGAQHLGGERRGETEADHRLHEAATAEAMRLDVLDERSDPGLVHHARASSIVVATSSASTIDSWFAMPFQARSNAVP